MGTKRQSKYVLLAMAATFFTPHSDARPSQLLKDYGNQNYGYGYDNRFNGWKNTWIGNGNVIEGQGHKVLGDYNQVAGKLNSINGANNRIKGTANSVHGTGNIVEGQGNIVISGDASFDDFDFNFDTPHFPDFPEMNINNLFSKINKEREQQIIKYRNRVNNSKNRREKEFNPNNLVEKRIINQKVVRQQSKAKSLPRKKSETYWAPTQRDYSRLYLPNYGGYFDRYSPNYADSYVSPFRRYF